MMKLKFGEIDPSVSADSGVDIPKFNKAQMVRTIRERNQYRGLYEEIPRTSGQLVPIVLSLDNS